MSETPTQPVIPLPETLAGIRETLMRDAYDHSDISEHMQAIREVAACVRRLREIAVGCSRPMVLNDAAEKLEQALWPMEDEAHRWDDDRAGRAWGDKLDARRLVRGE